MCQNLFETLSQCFVRKFVFPRGWPLQNHGSIQLLVTLVHQTKVDADTCIHSVPSLGQILPIQLCHSCTLHLQHIHFTSIRRSLEASEWGKTAQTFNWFVIQSLRCEVFPAAVICDSNNIKIQYHSSHFRGAELCFVTEFKQNGAHHHASLLVPHRLSS